jgi:hypothetical protein
MSMPSHARSYVYVFIDENTMAGVVRSEIMIGWHGEALSLAKLAKHPAIVASVVN